MFTRRVASVTLAREVARRTAGVRAKTLRADLGAAALELGYQLGCAGAPVTWPSPKYRHDIEGFFRDILGTRLWSKQIEVAKAAEDHLRISVVSAHKIGKTKLAGGFALWHFCTFADSRVMLTATKKDQVNSALWREVAYLHRRSGICADCSDENDRRREVREPLIERPCVHSIQVDGYAATLASTGIRMKDGREIIGFTARKAEAVAGISGARLCYIVDEASGVKQEIFEAIQGNRMGGNAHLLLFSNPTQTTGEFFDSHHSKKDRGDGYGYLSFQFSAEQTPNFLERRTVIPGIASYEMVMEYRRDCGGEQGNYRENPLYLVRVLGQFVLNDARKISSVAALNRSQAEWETAHYQDPEHPRFGEWREKPTGRLRVGLDPAGPGTAGDETVIVLVRGNFVIGVYPFRGLSAEAHLVHLRGILDDNRERGEIPLVAVDREGSEGIKVWGLIRAYADEHENEFAVIGIRSSDKARREAQTYDRVRDELWASGAQWIRNGGCIPSDVKLAAELHLPSWESKIDGRLKATSKEEIRKNLGRSPDRADAFNLAVFMREDTLEDPRALPERVAPPDVYETIDEPIGNPYDALSFDRLGRGE